MPRHSMTQETTANILDAHGEGLSNVAIAERVGFDRRTVARVLKAHGRHTADPRVKIIDIGNGQVKCTKCEKHMAREELPWARKKNNPYQLSYCRDCLTAQSVANTKKSIPQYLRHRQRAIRARCLKSGTPYDLPDGYIAELYEKQNGLCFYTDIPMRMYFGTKTPGPRPDSISVDQILPRQGYTVGNVVLATRRANIIKSDCTLEELAAWLPDWHRRLESRKA